jgi:transposase-like protein
MSKIQTVQTVCPHCGKPNAVQKRSHVNYYGLQQIQCAHCSKDWGENLNETEGLAKSAAAPTNEMADLYQRILDLGKVVDA